MQNDNKLKIVSLGGFGNVTSNMFAYELDNEILLVDCGMGFPTEDMLGVDILIPDISYLASKFHLIKALVITHGHEDHIGALPFILPKIPNVPVYASNLTAHMIMEKLAEYQNMPQKINILPTGQELKLGNFLIKSVHISHSIPDATNLIIKTRVGSVYHGSDYKFDFTPVYKTQPNVGQIAAAGNEGIDLLLSDCLGSERKGYTPSETTLDQMFEREMANCQGRVIVTTMGSNISRFQQAINAAIKYGRRVCVVGRSIDRNLRIAAEQGYINVPKNIFIDPKQARKLPPKNVCILAAGSQGQQGSAMQRLAQGEHKEIEIKPGDKVIFSSDPIPGSESAIQALIDSLSRRGAEVVYSDISDNLHVSGHGSQQDLLLMLALTRPKYVLPIGGTYRHMIQYSKLAEKFGVQKSSIMLPEHNQIIELDSTGARLGAKVNVRSVMVDGLGVGDVGNAVLRDRKVLAEEGVVVAVIQADQNDFSKLENVDIISKGFVFMKEHTQLLEEASSTLKAEILKKNSIIDSYRALRDRTFLILERFFFDKTGRRPMIIPVVVEV